jgi:hypothetical protein
MPSRRTFLKTGVAGGLLLAVAAVFHEPLDRLARKRLVDSQPRREAQRTVVSALVPVILRGVLPDSAKDRRHAAQTTADGVAIAIAALGATAQEEIAELFALLTLAPTRIAVAGLLKPWQEAAESDIEAFLTRWRHSRLGLLQSGYHALHDLVLGAWYADPSHWTAIGYAGPPRLLESGEP